MKNSRTQKCFVIASWDVDLSTVTDVLKKHLVTTTLPEDSARYPGSESALNELGAADWVLAVLPESSQLQHTAPDTFFELGYAFALGKPVLVISKSILHIPTWLAHRNVVLAEPHDREAISFAVAQMIAAPRSKRHHEAAPKRSKPLKNKADGLLKEFHRIRSSRLGSDIKLAFVAQLVLNALNESNLSAVENEPSTRGIDFAVWADELGSAIPNPIAVEVQWSAQKIGVGLLRKLDDIVVDGRAGLVVLLVAVGNAGRVLATYREHVSMHGSRVRIISVDDFFSALRTTSLPRFLLGAGDSTHSGRR